MPTIPVTEGMAREALAAYREVEHNATWGPVQAMQFALEAALAGAPPPEPVDLELVLAEIVQTNYRLHLEWRGAWSLYGTHWCEERQRLDVVPDDGWIERPTPLAALIALRDALKAKQDGDER